jgi:hypothetical protein
VIKINQAPSPSKAFVLLREAHHSLTGARFCRNLPSKRLSYLVEVAADEVVFQLL